VAVTNYDTAWPQTLQLLIHAPCDPLVQTLISGTFTQQGLAGGNNGMDFVPTGDDQWMTYDNTLPVWANSTNAEVCIRLIRHPSPEPLHPEAFYLDDINIGGGDIVTELAASVSPGTLLVAPNPAHGSLTLRGLPRGTAQVCLLDLAGRKVMQAVPTGAEMVLDITDLTPGIYVVAVDGAGTALRKRCMVE
jgi:hypothetical protein